MKSLLIKNGQLLAPANGYRREKKDIFIKNGKIEKIGENLNVKAENVIDAEGVIVTPGFIDIHTHCYPKAFLGLEPDVLGLERGATTILDAGSSGADNYEDFRTDSIEKAKTKVFTLLNVSKEGLIRGHELDSIDKLDEAKIKATAEKYCDNIVGLKARASQSVVGEMGLTPIAEAARIAHEIKKPLMIHVGNYPPALTDVLKLVDEGDIITHAYHGKKGGILTEKDEIIQEAKDARARGVRFDVGHGVASFSLRVYKQALLANFDCDLISTDLHVENYNGPVYNIASVMSKLINCGESLEQAVHKVTYVPAKHYGLTDLGEIREGCIADFNLLTVDSCEEEIADSIGDTILLKNKITVRETIYSRGEESEVFRKSAGNE